MSDRPSAINGKRSQEWGTMHICPACGQCLCFGCHPSGPCVDDEAGQSAQAAPVVLAGALPPFPVRWSSAPGRAARA